VRQRLSDKVSGHLVGIWLLVAEHLRLGTWDIVRSWTDRPAEHVEPRLALQLVHEAALCTTGIRSDRTLTHRGGFELANGLPFVGSDLSLHQLLNRHTVSDALRVQVALGKLRRVSGDFQGRVLAIDPHRVRSYSKRHMRMHADKDGRRPSKVAQTFWLLDADTHQPVCFSTSTSSRTVAQATPELLALAAEILAPQEQPAWVLADTEHCSAALLDHVANMQNFELLVPMSHYANLRKHLSSIPPHQFTSRWAGFATTKLEYTMKRSQAGPYWQYVQRNGERSQDWRFKAFLSTCDSNEVEMLAYEFPKRWHVEEFFNAHQALGWNRAGTQNINIRFGQMTFALIAQAIIHHLRLRLGKPFSDWDANHLAKDLFQGLDGDVRVTHDTIIVTYYNAPNVSLLRDHYENLPAKLAHDHIDPRIPWLYNFKLDFRFR
jgi:DDE family transposase